MGNGMAWVYSFWQREFFVAILGLDGAGKTSLVEHFNCCGVAVLRRGRPQSWGCRGEELPLDGATPLTCRPVVATSRSQLIGVIR